MPLFNDPDSGPGVITRRRPPSLDPRDDPAYWRDVLPDEPAGKADPRDDPAYWQDVLPSAPVDPQSRALLDSIAEDPPQSGGRLASLAPGATEAFDAMSGVPFSARGPFEDPRQEQAFQSWYSSVSDDFGLDPNPDAVEHQYDYRRAFLAGVEPDETTEHWPSQFKLARHPNRFIGGIDTVTDQALPTTLGQDVMRAAPPTVSGPRPVQSMSWLESAGRELAAGVTQDIPAAIPAPWTTEGGEALRMAIAGPSVDPSVIRSFVQRQRTLATTPMSTGAAALAEAPGVAGMASLAVRRPGALAQGVIDQTARSFGAFLPGLATAPATGPAGVGATSAALEFSNEFTNLLGQVADLTDERSVAKTLANEPVMEGIVAQAMVKAGVVGAADAATGKLTSMIPGGQTARQQLRALVAGTAGEMTGGMVGEAGSQLASRGRVTEGKDVLLEGLAEVPGAVPQMAALGSQAARPGVRAPSPPAPPAASTPVSAPAGPKPVIPPGPPLPPKPPQPAPPVKPVEQGVEQLQRKQKPEERVEGAGTSVTQPPQPIARPPARPAKGSDWAPRPALTTPAVEGRAGRLRLADGTERQVRYDLVEAEDLITTHKPAAGFEPDPLGDSNERAYEDPTEGEASRKTVRSIAEKLDPELLITDAPTSTDGPPITTDDYRVLGGNARSMALKLAYAQRGEGAARYRKALEAKASQYGLDPSKLAGMRSPVLVRRIEGDAGRRGELSRVLNESLTTAKTADTDAVSRGLLLEQEHTDRVAAILGEDSVRDVLGDPKRSADVVRVLVDAGAFSPSDLVELRKPDGSLDEPGKLAIERALLGAAVGDVRTLAQTAPGIRAKLIRALPAITRLRRSRVKDLNFQEVLGNALDALQEFRESGARSLEDLTSQTSMFESGWRNDARALALASSLLTDNQTKVAKKLGDVAAIAESAAGGQAGFDFGQPRSAADAFDEIFTPPLTKRAGSDAAVDTHEPVAGAHDVAGQEGLYGQGRTDAAVGKQGGLFGDLPPRTREDPLARKPGESDKEYRTRLRWSKPEVVRGTERLFGEPDDLAAGAPAGSDQSVPADQADAGVKRSKFSSTQLDLPQEVAAKVKALAAAIPDEDLAEDGREDRPHVTVKYGLHTENPGELAGLLQGHGPITVELGKTSLFRSDEHDVVKIDVESPELVELNAAISDELEHTDTHKTYRPHITIAYVKPGRGSRYAGDASLEGQRVSINRLVFSDRSRQETEFQLEEPTAGGYQGDEMTDELVAGMPPPARGRARARGSQSQGQSSQSGPPGSKYGAAPPSRRTVAQNDRNTPAAVARQVKQMREAIARATRDGKKLAQVQSFRSIMEDLSRALNLQPPGVGRAQMLKRSALGFYRYLVQDIRNRQGDSLRTHAHEIGHFLHELLFPSVRTRLMTHGARGRIDLVFPQAWRSELAKLGKALYGKQKPKVGGYTGEGWAETVRYLVIDPAHLKREAPTVYQGATRMLVQQHPEVWNALTRARLAYRAHAIAENPIRQYIFDSRSRMERGLRDQLDEAWYAFRVGWLDRFTRLADVKRDLELQGIAADVDPHVLALRASGRITGHMRLMIERGPWNIGDPAAKPKGPGLAAILAPVRDRIEEWTDYMVAKRVKEKQEQGFGGLMRNLTEADRDAIIAAGDADPVLRKAADQFQAFNEWLIRDYAVAHQLISPDAAEQIIDKNLHYITFRNVAEDGQIGRLFSGRRGRFSDQTSGIRRFNPGTGQELIDPIGSFLLSMEGIIARAQNNAVLRSITRLYDMKISGMGRFLSQVDRPQTPNKMRDDEFARGVRKQLEPLLKGLSDPTEADVILEAIDDMTAPLFFQFDDSVVDKKRRTIRILEGGKHRFFEVKDARLFDMLEGLASPANVDPWLSVLTLPGKALRAGATALNPEFFVPNFFRDTFSALTMTDAEWKDLDAHVRRRLRGMREAFLSGDVERMALAAGVDMSGTFGRYVNARGEVKMPELTGPRSLTGKVRGGRWGDAIADAASLGPIRRLNETFERLTRFGEFEAVRKGRSDSASIAKAGQAAADVTIDFTRGGNTALFANRYIPFFNAAIQGSSKLARFIAANPVRALARIFAMTVVPSMISMALNDDNDDYWSKGLKLRDQYWYYPIGKDERGRKQYVRLPKPYGLRLLANAAERTYAAARGFDPLTMKRGDTRAFRGFGKTVASDLLPPVNPAGLTPMLEVLAGDQGWSFYFDRPIVSDRDRDLPPGEQGASTSSELAGTLGRALEVPPAKVDYLVRGLFGGMGHSLVELGVDPIVAMAESEKKPQEPLRFEDYLVVRKFLASSTRGDHEALRRFFDDFDAARGYKLMVGRLADSGTPERAQAYIEQHRGALEAYERLQPAYTNLLKIFKERRRLLATPPADADELARQLDRLDQLQVEVIRSAYGGRSAAVR